MILKLNDENQIGSTFVKDEGRQKEISEVAQSAITKWRGLEKDPDVINQGFNEMANTIAEECNSIEELAMAFFGLGISLSK